MNFNEFLFRATSRSFASRKQFWSGRKARDRIGAFLLSLVAADSVTTGGLADAPTNTESLIVYSSPNHVVPPRKLVSTPANTARLRGDHT
jgi:hypothetical protein